MLKEKLTVLRLTGAIVSRGRPSTPPDELLAPLVELPSEHLELLRKHEGLEAYGGYFRVFGAATAIAWNAEDHWKFAWGRRASGFWCFGETAWGDQYAYKMAEVIEGGLGPVYFLDCLSMTAEVIAPDFERFIIDEFARCATDPYDALIVQAREKFGDLQSDSHLIYSPSPLLSGTEDVDSAMWMNAAAAMICNGDIAVQLDVLPPGALLSSVEPYVDAAGRPRIRLNWR